tara:strand:+ start:901 stop:1932 length:1032 start_codon:yes stop_codon:yes gene_type:complete
MASTYSALKIELIGTGEQSGTWGTTTNTNLGDAALGEAITGSADVAFSSSDVTVTLTDSNASQTARNLRLNLTGTSGGARQLILGSGCQIEKLYLINNGLADAVTVKNTSGTGIAVPAGKATLVYNNGTNVVDAATYFTSLTLGSALPIASGGTGSTSTTFVNAATNITGVLPIANGGTNATTLAGANIPVTTAANSFTNTQTFTGSTSVLGAVFQDAAEVTTISATAATGTIQYDVTTQSVLYYTSNAAANFTVNFRASSGTSLDTLMTTGQAVTIVFLVTNGATAYYNNALTIDGNSVTPKYQGGTAWSAGNASSIDAYSYTIVKTGSATFTVFAAQTQFK